ncbi:MAG: Fis family transcriptional regulator [Verrucomicrobia bacterium]|nr:MAG: Fis family transcriptional regulator [Verrucomicrobiota bacterium]
MASKILLVEGESDLIAGAEQALVNEGYEPALAHRGDDGLAYARDEVFAVVLTGLRVRGVSGLDLVTQLHLEKPRLPIIVVTAVWDSEQAIEATRRGAFDYLPAPFDTRELLQIVRKAVACELSCRLPLLTAASGPSHFGLVGRSRAMNELFREIGKAGGNSIPVLIRGETGTGKELVAWAIHSHSARADHLFVPVNSAALPESLLESELFGYERGAFTGAQARRLGHFESAGKGTIFLDEIGDLSLSAQAKLLRVLQEEQIQRLGSSKIIPIEARVLSATHRDLETAVAEKRFRDDLFFRLNGMEIILLPLRERMEELHDLVTHFLRRSGLELNLAEPSIQSDAFDFLREQTWPGNIRQLKHVIHRALLEARNHPITLAHAEAAYNHPHNPHNPKPAGLKAMTIGSYMRGLVAGAQTGQIPHAHAQMIHDMDWELVTCALEATHGNKARAAHLLDITRNTIRAKLQAQG